MTFGQGQLDMFFGQGRLDMTFDDADSTQPSIGASWHDL